MELYMYIKDYARKLESGPIQEWANQFHVSIRANSKLYTVKDASCIVRVHVVRDTYGYLHAYYSDVYTCYYNIWRKHLISHVAVLQQVYN